MSKEQAGRTEGNGTTQQTANSRYVHMNDCTTAEALSLEVKRCEREHDEFLRMWLIPYAKQCASMGRRFSVGEFCDHKSWAGVSAPNHNDQPILSRLLMEVVPEVKGLVEIRKSKWDEVFSARSA